MDVEKYVVGVCVKQSLYASVLRTVPYDHSHLYSHTHTQLRFLTEKRDFFLRAVNNDLSCDHKEQLLQFLSYLNALIQIFGDELVN